MIARTLAGVALVLTLALLGAPQVSADVGGDRRPVLYYKYPIRSVATSEARLDISIEVEIDKFAFPLNSFQGYKIVRVDIRNMRGTPIDLSSKADGFEMVLEGAKTAKAVLDLGKDASRVWDSLDSETRKALAYPVSLEKGHIRHLYILFPSDKVSGLPLQFNYRIKSLGKTLTIGQPPATGD